eukprot:4886366-Amphidinium_carterae.1
MSQQLYGSPSYGHSVPCGFHQASSSTGAPCPPGLVRTMGDGFRAQPSSFVPPPTIYVGQYAHPGSPSVNDCACVSGGVMNTFEIEPDPYGTVRQSWVSLDVPSASGFHESCSVSGDHQMGSGP